MRPSRDPNSTKYPDRTFYQGAWRTPEQIERKREQHRERKRERYANDPEYRGRTRRRQREWEREQYANDPAFRLKIAQKNTLRNLRLQLALAISRAEDL